MVFITSTNGTCETTTLNRSGQVGDGAHEQTSGRAALDGDALARAVLVGHQMLGAGDEVGEGVHLVHHAAGIMPGFAHLAAAANVNVGHDHAPVKERKTRRAESIGSVRSV